MAFPPGTQHVGWTVTPYPLAVAGLTVPSEMLYVGHGLAAVNGRGPEPALVVPWLPVDWQSPDWDGRSLEDRPSYSQLSPQARAAYLHWLAGGRRHAEAPVGYAFLFLYGLERRVLHDLAFTPAARDVELPVIARELDRLLGLFGGHALFRRHAAGLRRFIEFLDLSRFDLTGLEPPAPDREDVPVALRLGLNCFAASGRPLPAGWALAWLESRPDHRPRAAAVRCPREFAALLARRYPARFGDGLRVRPHGPDLRVEYRAASAGFDRPVEYRLVGRPDVLDQPAPLRALAALAGECADALDPYARLLARDPDARGSLAAVALLPEELRDSPSGQAGALLDWARSHLGALAAVTVPAERLAELLGGTPAKRDLVTAARVLARAGVGMEPDPRMGGPVQTSGPMVLFQAEEDLDAPTAAYRAAAVLLHLGAAVGAADGEVSAEEKDLLAGHLEQALDLSPGERARLRAHLRWLLTTELRLTGLTRRIEALAAPQRERVAEFLTAVAEADGVVDAAEVRLLRRIRKMLGLDPARVPDAAPRRPAPEAAPSVPAPRPAPEETPGLVRLDASLLAARLAEAAEVAALLGSVFSDEDEPDPPPPPVQEAPVAGLDAAHSALLRALAGREEISRAAWERLAAEARLMPDGALDRLNEAAFEHAGGPVAEGDDPIEIDQRTLEEMLGEMP